VNQAIQRLDDGLNRANEIRKAAAAKARQKSTIAQTMEKKHDVHHFIKSSQSTMTSPKIQQVSSNNADLLLTIQRMNEERAAAEEKQKQIAAAKAAAKAARDAQKKK
jgi:hypothetical protein